MVCLLSSSTLVFCKPIFSYLFSILVLITNSGVSFISCHHTLQSNLLSQVSCGSFGFSLSLTFFIVSFVPFIPKHSSVRYCVPCAYSYFNVSALTFIITHAFVIVREKTRKSLEFTREMILLPYTHFIFDTVLNYN